mmetsp:Transcript_22102/g.25565  ORF Transcript_22102/g.25565 Transcript_22102/m.25565 type:complete len:631 (-) Transcript_22102:41-1933(-)
MASLYLPAPKRTVSNSINKPGTPQLELALTTSTQAAGSAAKTAKRPNITVNAPSYEKRCQAALEFSRLPPTERKSKKLFVPRSIADFDDGGSFPEIHVAQYPKHMGNPHLKKPSGQGSGPGASSVRKAQMTGASVSTTQAIVNVEINAQGQKDYTSLIKGGTNTHKTVYATHADLKGYQPSKQELALPSYEESKETANKTQEAINNLLQSKIALAKPSGTALENASTSQNQSEKTQFISYTPNPNAPGYNAAAASKRIIQMVPKQLDPMMPPKHKHEKAPPGPAEDFTPVLHAPPEKLTKEERESWNVPACISNWKNTRGYTIPLDKRLAADGRGLRDDTTINTNFATLSESLYLAERNAREEVRMRALVKKRQVETEREKREKELRELAMRAREERGGGGVMTTSIADRKDDKDAVTSALAAYGSSSEGEDDDEQSQENQQQMNKSTVNIIPEDISTVQGDEEEAQRERIRQERRRERERELRQEKQKPKRKGEEEEEEDVAIKKARLGDRDVSEKIALGVHTGSGIGGGVDSRLYNQSAGLSSGFGAEDEYNTYTKPMFDREGVNSSSIYRPTRGEAALDADEQYNKLKTDATSRFQPDRGFKGAEGGNGMASNGPRNAPVQFEKERN